MLGGTKMSLFNSPIYVGHEKIKNRLVIPPIATAKADEDGHVTKDLCQYYDEKSKGAYIGLIMTEHSFVSLEGRASRGQLSMSKDEDIEGLKALVSTIHRNDTKVFAQISHAGGAAQKIRTGYDALSASAVRIPRVNAPDTLPKEMTLDDIQKLIACFSNAAIRAQKAGFDGVEIHSAHGYLLNQFFSPLTNKRHDQYTGENMDGRIKLHLDIIKAIKEAVGSQYPVALRLGACDYMEGGITLQDSLYACQAFEKAGVDLLDISGGFNSYRHPTSKEQGYFSELTEEIKKVVQVPVILTGGVVEAEAAERLLQEHKADMIGVGRAILKDSQWAKHAMLSLK